VLADADGVMVLGHEPIVEALGLQVITRWR